MNANFKSLFCSRHQIPADQFAAAVLPRVLTGPAVFFFRLLIWLNPHHFARDLEFIELIGLLRRRREYSHYAEEFMQDSRNQGLLRGGCRLRLSPDKLKALLFAEIKHARRQAAAGGQDQGGEPTDRSANPWGARETSLSQLRAGTRPSRSQGISDVTAQASVDS